MDSYKRSDLFEIRKGRANQPAFAIGQRVWIVPYRPVDGSLSTGVVEACSDRANSPLATLLSGIQEPTIFLVRLDLYDGDPRPFPETDLRVVGWA
jgi:hypothetical protein